MGERVVLAMSGGVDSSVAAYLLKEQGYEVIGLFMRTGAHADDVERRAKTCCSATDAVDARGVADRLDIPFYALDFERDFARIMDQFADEYAAGPDAEPVRDVQHLAQVRQALVLRQAGRGRLRRHRPLRPDRRGDATARRGSRAGVDRSKDQSYVLFGLRRELLPHVLFPVGGYPKAEIRAIARANGLPVHDKPDSQEICFVPSDDYLGFVRDRRPDLDTAGDDRRRGRHGPRPARGDRGVHDRPAPRARDRRRRAALRRPDRAAVEDRDGRPSRSRSTRPAWRRPGSTGRDRFPTAPIACLAQIRAQHQAVPATVEPLPDGRARVVFDDPGRGRHPRPGRHRLPGRPGPRRRLDRSRARRPGCRFPRRFFRVDNRLRLIRSDAGRHREGKKAVANRHFAVYH